MSGFYRRGIILLLMAFFVLIHPEPAVAQAKPRVAVLLYHHITPEARPQDAKNNAIIPVGELEAQMEALYNKGYYAASLSELEDFVYDQGELPEKTVVITFDDGYLSNYTLAFPVLEKYGFKAAIFPIGSSIPEQDEPEDPPRLVHFSYEQMKAMVDSGIIEFGNHTFDAHKIEATRYGLVGMSKEAMEEDLEKFQEALAVKTIPFSNAIAYPMGKYNASVIDAAKNTGHTLGFTVKKGFIYPGSSPMTLNRFIVAPGTEAAKFLSMIGDKSPDLPEGFEESIVLGVGSNTAYIKGKPQLLGASAFILDGRVMVPLRFVAEALGAKVSWEGGKVLVDGIELTPEVPPVMRNDRVMVPLRFLSEALGFGIKWHPELRMVQLR